MAREILSTFLGLIVTIQTQFRNGYKSRQANLIYSCLFIGDIVIEESSAVGTVIGVLFLFAVLGAALGYFMLKHRKLRRSFQVYYS